MNNAERDVERAKAVQVAFRITCQKCGGDRLSLSDNIRYSDYTGTYGSVDLECLACGNSAAVYEP